MRTCALGQRGKLMNVQTFVAQPPTERFNKRIFLGFLRLSEVRLDAALG
jgi:hypothetical protein